MRQVPHYLLIGNGRVSKHFQHYLTSLQLSYSVWHRALAESVLRHLSSQATHVLLLINDSSIASFIEQHTYIKQAMCLYFSGSLVLDHVYGAHPLMCFSTELYEHDQYITIPFIIDNDAPAWEELLPGLSNPHVRLSKELKSLYHALCVIGGNFSCLLWQKVFNEFEKQLEIPANLVHPYLKQQMANLLANPNNALTGPLVRGDMITIEKNLQALTDDPMQAVYQSFVTYYQEIKRG